jgi:hypothetical protein
VEGAGLGLGILPVLVGRLLGDLSDHRNELRILRGSDQYGCGYRLIGLVCRSQRSSDGLVRFVGGWPEGGVRNSSRGAAPEKVSSVGLVESNVSAAEGSVDHASNVCESLRERGYFPVGGVGRKLLEECVGSGFEDASG